MTETPIPAPAQVKVKPLVWVRTGSDYRAELPLFGRLRVETYSAGIFNVVWSVPGYCDTFIDGDFATAEEAEAAAQTHYDAMIMSAIEVTP